MKANEAPEKIYLQENTTTDCYGEFLPEWFEARAKETDIEYTRTDDFVEKAIEYISEHIEYYMKKDKTCNIPLCPIFEKQSFIEGFRKYMEGE